MEQAAQWSLACAFLLFGPTHALSPSVPPIELFIARLLAAIQPDGRFDIATHFDCGPPDDDRIVSCLDQASGVGFRFRRDSTTDVIDMPIVLHEGETAPTGFLRGQIPVTDRADYKRFEAAVSRLPDSTALSKLKDCPLGTSPNSDEPAVWIAKQNPVGNTVIGFLLADSEYATYGLKGFYNRRLEGYQVGEFIVLNALPTPCRSQN